MNKELKLSILTPCYNSGKIIGKTLESVRQQQYSNIEHIFIDGGSTDDTISILKEYQNSAGYEVKIISEPDGGIYDAMNKGIRLSSGDLIGIINSDDWYEEDAFKKVLDAYSGKPKEVVYGMISLYDGEHLRSMEFYHHDFLLDRMINHPGCFITAGAYDDIGLYNTSFRSSADYEWMKRAYDAGIAFTPVYEVLANVRMGGMSSTNVGFRETLKLQYEWGRISRARYLAYDIKSRISDLVRRPDRKGGR